METPTRTPLARRLGAALAVIAAVAGLAACGSSAKPAAAGTHPVAAGHKTSAVSGHRVTAVTLPPGVTNATKVPASVPNDVALRKDVTLAGCGRAAMGWRAAGTARDPAVAATTYKITVFFTTSAATVIGTGATRVRVPGHASAHWDVIARFHAPAGTLCVLRGVG